MIKPLLNPDNDIHTGRFQHEPEINFKELVDSFPGAIFVLCGHKVLFANKRAAKLVNAAETDKLTGRGANDFFPELTPDSLNRIYSMLKTKMEEDICIKSKMISFNGKIKDTEISPSCFNLDGTDCIQLLVREISKNRKIKKTPGHEKNYRVIFEAANTALFFIEEDKTVSLINGECEKITGYTRSEIEGKKKWTEFISPDDLKTLETSHYLRKTNADTPLNFEFTLIDKYMRSHRAFMNITMIPGTKKSVASIIDLTEIKKSEEILAATEQNYRLLVENTNEAIAIIQDKTVRYVNPKLCEITGYPEEHVLNKKIHKLLGYEYNDMVMNEYTHRLNGVESGIRFPVKIIDTGNTERWFQINSVLTMWEEKPAVLLFFNDITETKIAQDALMASEEKYRLLAENAKDIIIVYDENGAVSYLNNSGYETFGIKKETKSLINVSDILLPCNEYLKPSALIGDKNRNFKTYKNRIEVPNFLGDIIQLETISSPIKLDNDNYGILVVGRDITERKQLEREIILISERIRQQVSHDLHDDLNPHLIGIEALSQVLFMSLKQKGVAESADAEKIVSLIKKAIKKTHRLARGLCPIDLESSGMQTPLMNLSKLVRNFFSIECKFTYDESITIEDINLATNLYYIAQEATLNAAKYSECTLINITLKRNNDTLTLSIEDNGIGIQRGKAGDRERSTGMGLKIMKYRAEIIDGVFTINKNKPSGTAIIVKIPINILKSEGRISYGGRFPKTKPEKPDIYS